MATYPQPQPPFELRVFYDGLCPLCSKEIDIYRKQKLSSRIDFIDIAAPEFQAKEFGLDPDNVHKKFHAQTMEMKTFEGVDAFIQIWQTLEIWQPLQWAATNKALRPLFNLGYVAFAKVRPLFRKNSCESDYCTTS